MKKEKAEKHLAFAYVNCHPSSARNRKLILVNLIPVRMLLGKQFILSNIPLIFWDVLKFLQTKAHRVCCNLMSYDIHRNHTFFDMVFR